MTPSDIARFWSKVDQTGECWLWTAAVDRDGYGRLKVARRWRSAHRLSVFIATGEEPPRNLHVCHRCDTPACVNPAHLFLGDHQMNMRDMVSKGRSTSGAQHAAAVLTAHDVELIRRLSALEVKQRVIAAAFGISTSNVAHIVTGRTWTDANPSSPVAA